MPSSRIPPYVTRYFWGDSIQELDLTHNTRYIVETLLNFGDTQAISWLFSSVPKEEVRAILPTLKLDTKSKNFWEIYLNTCTILSVSMAA